MFCCICKTIRKIQLNIFSLFFNNFSTPKAKRLSAFRGFVIIILYKNKKYKEDTR